jgi:hypothetical protein
MKPEVSLVPYLKRWICVEIAQFEKVSGGRRVNRGRPLPSRAYFRDLLGVD